jgi:hypothetical protein
MAWAVEITEKVNQISDLPFRLYTNMFSAGVGTLTWGCGSPDLAALEAVNDKLAADDGFAAISNRGQQYTTGELDDTLLQVIHNEPDPGTNPEYIVAVTGLQRPGELGKGLEVGVKIAEAASRITGARTAFGVSATGDYGGVAWVTGFEDVRAMEAANTALGADESFLKLVDDEGSKCFESGRGATVQTIYRRVG